MEISPVVRNNLSNSLFHLGLDYLEIGQTHTYQFYRHQVVIENKSSRPIYTNLSSNEGLPHLLVTLDGYGGSWRSYKFKDLHITIDDAWLDKHHFKRV